jgi:hypothetical protein
MGSTERLTSTGGSETRELAAGGGEARAVRRAMERRELTPDGGEA